jgi:hypothetical protein
MTLLQKHEMGLLNPGLCQQALHQQEGDNKWPSLKLPYTKPMGLQVVVFPISLPQLYFPTAPPISCCRSAGHCRPRGKAFAKQGQVESPGEHLCPSLCSHDIQIEVCPRPMVRLHSPNYAQLIHQNLAICTSVDA